MKRILVLHDNPSVLKRLRSVLSRSGYKVVANSSVEEAKKLDSRSFNICLCGQMGRYSDGLIFALDAHSHGVRVAIVSDRRKFHRFPFLNVSIMSDNQILLKVRELLTGGH